MQENCGTYSCCALFTVGLKCVVNLLQLNIKLQSKILAFHSSKPWLVTVFMTGFKNVVAKIMLEVFFS